MENLIYIFDTTLRDGEQSPGCSMNIEEKFRLARQLQLLCVDAIEAGFPIASVGDFEAVKLIAEKIKTLYGRGTCSDCKIGYRSRLGSNPKCGQTANPHFLGNVGFAFEVQA